MIDKITEMQDFVILHTRFQESLDMLNMMFHFQKSSHESNGLTLIGSTGTGKTSLIRQFVNQHGMRSWRNAEGVTTPILWMEVPTYPTTKEFVASLLQSLGAPAGPTSETIALKTERLITLIKHCGVKVIILEEFQHFIRKRQDDKISETGDWLKSLMNRTNILLVISGSSKTLQVLNTNAELARRCSVTLELGTFDWDNTSDQAGFAGVMQAFIGKLNEMDIRLSDLSFGELCLLFYEATEGRICHIKKLLILCLQLCIQENRNEILITDLASAWNYSLKVEYKGKDNPFSRFAPGSSDFGASEAAA